MHGLERLDITDAGGGHLGDQDGAVPLGLDVHRHFLRPQRPGDVTAMANLVIGCHEMDHALSKQLICDLPVERLVVGLNPQEEIGPLLDELPKNTCCL